MTRTQQLDYMLTLMIKCERRAEETTDDNGRNYWMGKARFYREEADRLEQAG